MRKSKYTPERIATALRQAESGTPVAELCRKLQVTKTTFCRWRKKFGGMGPARCASFDSCVRRIGSSSNSLPARVSTRQFCRSRSKKNGELDAATYLGRVGTMRIAFLSAGSAVRYVSARPTCDSLL
jgi:transposase-like protein